MSSTAITCEMCEQPMPDTAYVCTRCTARTAGALRTVIALADDVETTVARLARYSDRHARPAPVEPDEEVRAVGGLRTTRLPYDPAAGQRWATSAGAIVSAARRASETRGAIPMVPRAAIGPLCRSGAGCRHVSCRVIREKFVPHPVARAAGYLTGQLDWLRHRPEATETLAALDRAAATIVAIVDSPPPLEYAGPCYAPLAAGGECQEHLYAIMGAPTVRCPACGTRLDMTGRRAWLLREVEDVLANATDCARALTSLGQPVTASSVRNLADRGRIVAHGRDDRGRPLYRVGEVRAVVDQIARRAVARAA